VAEEWVAVLAGFAGRMRTLDPLLPDPRPLPDPVDCVAALTVPGGFGCVRRVLVDSNDLSATWLPLDQRWLLAQVNDPVAMAALLARWRGQLAGTPAGPDSVGIVLWPSRDVAMTPVFLAHGLVPEKVIAVRPAGRPTPGASEAVRVRPAVPSDLDVVVSLRLEEVRFGAHLTSAPERPNTAALMRDACAARLAADEPWVWLAESGGETVGVVSVALGERAAWIAARVAAAPVAYVDGASVAPTHRSGGVGAALISHVHQALDRAGVAVTLLHHDVLNPLSAPFWHRSGYRPLWTRWLISPAR
jgi:GNAT superfamily N-acetyltransferase